MPRPGFVLEVDERTPPLLVHEGEGFRMHKFPLGTNGPTSINPCKTRSPRSARNRISANRHFRESNRSPIINRSRIRR